MQTSTTTHTNEQLQDGGSQDQMTHLFCPAQQQVADTLTKTARCGKTKAGWKPGTGTDMLCTVCYDLYRTGHCAHCQNGAGA